LKKAITAATSLGLRSDGFTSASGGYEILEKTLRKRVLRHALRMPLNSYDPVGIAGPFDGFDRAVRGIRCDAEVFSRPVDGLVMAAVDMGRRGTGKLRKKAPWGQHGIVVLIGANGSCREIGGSVRNGERAIGPHIRDVLNQGAMEMDVEDLAAITDGQDRLR